VEYGRLLAIWLVVRTAVWLAVVAQFHPNAPLDVIEVTGWGEIRWGYPYHPPVPVWLANAAIALTPGEPLAVSLLGILASGVCLWAAWRVGREYLPPNLALLAALALDGLKFLSFDAFEWNNDVALNVGWMLTILCGTRAVRTGALRWWVGLGLAAGFAVLCKYTAGFLLLPLAGYFVVSPVGRRHLRRPGPYLAVGLAAAVISPHLAWLVANDYAPIRYASERTADLTGGGRETHVLNPLVFHAHQAVFVAPVAFVLWPLLRRRGEARPAPAGGADPWFLRAAVFAPVALFTLYAAVTGCRLRDSWGATFWTLLGVWALAEFGRRDDPAKSRAAFARWGLTALAVMALFAVKQSAGPHLDPHPDRTHFPGRALADEVNRRWAMEKAGPLPVVAGEAWLAGNVCCYSTHRPTLFSRWEPGPVLCGPEACPWTGDADLDTRGGYILWDIRGHGPDLPPDVKARFPRALLLHPISFPYQTKAPIPPLMVGVALVQPRK
jgi:4-amino-4-deoxy-L-arabinose transferase-like glycosyltransferase